MVWLINFRKCRRRYADIHIYEGYCIRECLNCTWKLECDRNVCSNLLYLSRYAIEIGMWSRRWTRLTITVFYHQCSIWNDIIRFVTPDNNLILYPLLHFIAIENISAIFMSWMSKICMNWISKSLIIYLLMICLYK